MRSSAGQHFIALDHVRALAALLVFTWHFNHWFTGFPIPLEFVPAVFPMAIFDEGHTGVALFMTLSGYLFAKLLDGKAIDFKAFLWNRALRLLPILCLVLLFTGIRIYLAGGNIQPYVLSIMQGLVLPTLPHGGWSITVELHYYLVLPLLLWMFRGSRFLPIGVVIAAILLRHVIHHYRGEVQTLAYWTLIGRIDQFVIGMLVFHFRSHFVSRHFLALGIATAFTLFYWVFDMLGGFSQYPAYPSPSWLWIYLPTIEALAYASLIAWYEGSFRHSTSGISRFAGRAGEYSYSIYLLHGFFVSQAAVFIDKNIMSLSNFYVACFWAFVTFLLMMPVGYLSYRFVESPFLRLRKRYYKDVSAADSGAMWAQKN